MGVSVRSFDAVTVKLTCMGSTGREVNDVRFLRVSDKRRVIVVLPVHVRGWLFKMSS